jgi:hypothetical protein
VCVGGGGVEETPQQVTVVRYNTSTALRTNFSADIAAADNARTCNADWEY